MEELKVKIELEPARDGIVWPEDDNEIKSDIHNTKGLVVGTDGNFRTLDLYEMDRVFEELGDNGMARSLSDDYVICFSSNAVIYTNDSRYLVGSVLVLKTGKDSRVKDLTDIDIKKIRTLFQMGLVNLTFGDEKFQAYPLEQEDKAA